MRLSRLSREVKGTPTLRLNEEARSLCAKGELVIHVGNNESMNSKPVPAILSSSVKFKTGAVKFTPTDGLLPLKTTLIHCIEENYHSLDSRGNIVISTGEK